MVLLPHAVVERRLAQLSGKLRYRRVGTPADDTRDTPRIAKTRGSPRGAPHQHSEHKRSGHDQDHRKQSSMIQFPFRRWKAPNHRTLRVPPSRIETQSHIDPLTGLSPSLTSNRRARENATWRRQLPSTANSMPPRALSIPAIPAAPAAHRAPSGAAQPSTRNCPQRPTQTTATHLVHQRRRRWTGWRPPCGPASADCARARPN